MPSPRLRLLVRACVLGVACVAGRASAQTGAPPPSSATPALTPPAAPPSPRDVAEAKRRFEAGKKLYAEHACTEALAEFEVAYGLVHRPSMLRNIGLCHRELRHFAEAYDAYDRLLKIHGTELTATDRDAVKQALDELSELSAALVLTSNEAGANVEVDGKSLGTTPVPGSFRVSLSSHHVVVTKPGFEPFTKDVAVQPNQSVTVEVTLAPEITTGHVTVHEENGDPVDVNVDGQDRGPAPWEGDLPPGEHTLEAKGPKFAAARQSFTLVKKQRLDLAVDATTTMGHVRITTLPASATIAFDGAQVGTGVWDAEVAPGSHHVDVALGNEHSAREVDVVRGQMVALDIPLATAGGSEPYKPVYRGAYGRFSFFGEFSPSATDVYPASDGGHAHFHGGGGATVNIGYAFDPFAVEFFGAYLVDAYSYDAPSNTTGNASGSNTGSNTSRRASIFSLGGFFGVGARVTSRAPTVRVTAALIPGVAVRVVALNSDGYDDVATGGGASACNGSLNRCPGSSSSQFNENAGYAAPGLAFDGGMLVGHSPGAKFFLGLTAWLDFAPTLYVGPDTAAPLPASDFYGTRALKVVSGPQFFFGPTLGVQFGH